MVAVRNIRLCLKEETWSKRVLTIIKLILSAITYERPRY